MLDTDVSRNNPNDDKWGVSQKDPDLLPMTVADMDIATPEFIRDALQNVLNQKVLGYFHPSAEFYDAFIHWQKLHHGMTLTRNQIILMPSVAVGLSFVIRNLTQVGDGVIVMSPYYPPYREIIEGTHRQFVDFPLIQIEGQYVIDFNQLDQLMTDTKATTILVCNPHNPGGRVWTNMELQRLHDLANAHGMLVIADEIHDDTVFSDNTPVSMLADLMGDEAAGQTVLLKSATKAFNLAGVKTSFLVTKDSAMLSTLRAAADAEALEELNTFGLVATRTAYEQGEQWLSEVNAYLQDNRDFAYEYIRENIPLIRPMYPEGSFLMWLDFMAYGLSDEELDDKLKTVGHISLKPGVEYGASGHGFMRLNFAVDRVVLEDALHRLEAFDKAVKGN